MELRTEPASPQFDQWGELLSLILKSFNYMDKLINPSSSALRLTPKCLKAKAETEHLQLAREQTKLVGCAFFHSKKRALYIGKIAVLPNYQGLGLSKQFISDAEKLARSLDLDRLELETRIELIQNHRVFTKRGFVKTGEKSHPGFSRPTSITMTKFLRHN